MKLGLIVRRVTAQQGEDGVLTAVRFDYVGGATPKTKDVTPLGTLLFIGDLSYVYSGPPRHRVGDEISLAIEEQPRVV